MPETLETAFSGVDVDDDGRGACFSLRHHLHSTATLTLESRMMIQQTGDTENTRMSLQEKRYSQ